MSSILANAVVSNMALGCLLSYFWTHMNTLFYVCWVMLMDLVDVTESIVGVNLCSSVDLVPVWFSPEPLCCSMCHVWLCSMSFSMPSVPSSLGSGPSLHLHSWQMVLLLSLRSVLKCYQTQESGCFIIFLRKVLRDSSWWQLRKMQCGSTACPLPSVFPPKQHPTDRETVTFPPTRELWLELVRETWTVPYSIGIYSSAAIETLCEIRSILPEYTFRRKTGQKSYNNVTMSFSDPFGTKQFDFFVLKQLFILTLLKFVLFYIL